MKNSSTPLRTNVAHLLLQMKGNETKLPTITETVRNSFFKFLNF